MPHPASQGLQFFLGVNGHQTGPFSENQILQQIQQGTVPADSLVWYEGLSDWQPINSIEYFKGSFEGARTPAMSTRPSSQVSGFKPLSEEDSQEHIPTKITPESDSDSDSEPASRGSSTVSVTGAKPKKRSSGRGEKSTSFQHASMEPVFKEEGSFGPSSRNQKRIVGWLVIGSLAGAGAFGLFYASSYLETEEELPFVEARVPKAGSQGAVGREAKTRKALSELLLSPNESVQALVGIVRENSDDASGKEALTAVLEFYKQRQMPQDAGRLLMEAKRPQEAAKYFLSEPPAYQEAEAAIFAAYNLSKEANRRDLLLQDINLLLGPLKNATLAVERVRLLEKDFPRERHPYNYYLKTVDQKIADIFQRISFHFVQGLLSYMQSELPQLNFVSRPLVQVKKEKLGYRLVGTYKGEVLLNQDRLKKISFVFWQYNEQWAVVETNVTVERERFSRQERRKRDSEVVPAEKMLDFMQNTFLTLFPNHAFHENVEIGKAAVNTKSVTE